MDFNVRPGVLIPRSETEELVDWICDDAKGESDLSILDIGTGSGCIAISLAKHLEFPNVTALDFSKTAIDQTKENAELHKVKIKLIETDMYHWQPISNAYDIIVSNPPYIAPDEKDDMEVRVKDFEPEEALFVDADDPIKPYKRVEEIASKAVKPNGKVYLELNPRFADQVKTYYESKGWQDVEIRLDSYGKKRMLKATRI